jgi:anti-sigma regulatory factor (Ser/Thr protein kinase)
MTGWSRTPPPDADEEIASWSIDQPPQLRALRAALERWVRSEQGTPAGDAVDLVERLIIVATELAGNALRHGRPPTTVELLRSDRLLVVDVSDGDPSTPPTVDTGRSPGAGGLGLQLAERLAQDVGWYPAAGRKHVWATFELSPSPAAFRNPGH